MKPILFLCTFLLLTLTPLLLWSQAYKAQYKAQVQSMDDTHLVAQPFTIYYQVTLPKDLINQNDIDFLSTDEIEIQNVLFSYSSSNNSQPSEDNNITFIAYSLQITMIAKTPGIHIIPHINIDEFIITLPYVFVHSNLNPNNLALRSMFSYMPFEEIGQLLLFFLLMLLFLLLNVKLCAILMKKSRVVFNNIKNFVNVSICISQVNKILSLLRKVSSSDNRRHLVTHENYERLLKIMRKRINFLYVTHKGDTSTPEEIAMIFIDNMSLDDGEVQKVKDMFLVFDEVLYGKKKMSVEMRVLHSNITKNLLIKSYKNGEAHNRFFNVSSYHNDMSIAKKENFNVF